MDLPVDDFVNYGLLFCGGTAEVDTCGFYAFVTHEISKKSEIAEAVEEVLGETMSE